MGFWNKKILGGRENDFFGLDISDFSIKLFQLEKKGRLDKIRSFGSIRLKEGCIRDGRVLNKEAVAESLKELIKKSEPKKINTKKVICSLPESKVFLRILNIPEINQEEAKEAIKWEIEASVPLSVDQVYFDWRFLEKKEGKQNVILVTIAKEVVDDLVSVLEYAGLMVCGLEMESIATVRSLIPKDIEPSERFLIVDMGEEKTSFIITEGNIPRFTSSIPFSSSGLTDQIVSVLNVNKNEAEKIKIEHGIENSSENNSIFNSIKPFLENLSVEVEKTIDFYQGLSESSSKINKIILSGGGANLKGLASYFTERLSMDVALGNPWINFKLGKKLPIVSREDSVRYATAVGLAMWKCEN